MSRSPRAAIVRVAHLQKYFSLSTSSAHRLARDLGTVSLGRRAVGVPVEKIRQRYGDTVAESIAESAVRETCGEARPEGVQLSEDVKAALSQYTARQGAGGTAGTPGNAAVGPQGPIAAGHSAVRDGQESQ